MPKHQVAVEVDGGTWSRGSHTRGAGYAKDAEKGNAAVLLGWRVLHFTTDQIKSGYALRTIRDAIDSATP